MLRSISSIISFPAQSINKKRGGKLLYALSKGVRIGNCFLYHLHYQILIRKSKSSFKVSKQSGIRQIVSIQVSSTLYWKNSFLLDTSAAYLHKEFPITLYLE